MGNHAANYFVLYATVFPHTLSLPHLLTDHTMAVQNVASSCRAIHHFIGMHATDNDCHEQLDYICSIRKPCKMDTQIFFSCLQELSNQVDWLLGNDLPLTEMQLHQDFVDGMPPVWKECYENAGCSVHKDAQADILKYL
jgi:hypothetical protein